ncbi:MAG: hypothetical protein QOH93_664 [Chloroflexia bacterium]|jgi:hypothetical protein|nr:hypothetical protein [Chloroflexia bacterium]
MAMLETAILKGVAADLPTDNTAFTKGRTYYQTDGGGKIWRDNGTDWDDVTPGGGGGAYDIGTWYIVGDTGVPYENDWAGADTKYTKDSNGWVHITGYLYGGDHTGAVAFTLPVGYRPPAEVWIAIVAGDISTSTASIMPSGEVIFQDPGSISSTASLHVSFYVG